LAWHTYAADHNDALPSNKWRAVTWQDDCPDGYQTGSDCWVMGDAKTDRDTWGIKSGSLFDYVKAVDCYHCPADTSKVDGQPNLVRKRSYSMSYYMNGIEHKPQRKTKLSLVTNPSRVFVFLDEHENSIVDGVFYVHVPGDAGEHAAGPHWMDVPANRHGGGCDLSFADGHTAHWKWRWPLRSESDNSVANPLDLQDLRQLQEGIPTR
jgi:prepilin-type processing-associated H-X9-DG protein